jgi:hypothetical protein
MTTRIPRFFLFCLSLGFLLFPVTAVSADRWVEVRSAHFTVCSNSGESEARRIANQMEEIRAVFLTTLPELRVDPGKPIIVIAVRNEDSLRLLLTDYWATKDRMHPTGIFLPALDRNFAVLRTDLGGSKENPYHSLYFEYTQNVLRLNYPVLPTWLSVGLSEYYGNTLVEFGEIGVGHASRAQLEYLKKTLLIPLPDLLTADSRSPLLNLQDRATLFYAESWALVHYLLNDPDARKAQWFFKYLKAFDETNDSQEAAKQVFGDLKHMQLVLETYSRDTSFKYQRFKPQAPISDKSYPVRDMTLAEALTTQGDFLAHLNHPIQAREMFKQALEQKPDAAAPHIGLGYIEYLQHNNDAALTEFDNAISLDQQDFRPYHFRALLMLRKSGYGKESTPQIIANLEKVISLNPDFAPAYGFLSVAYRQQDATKAKSFDAAIKASKLEPANYNFMVDIGDALLALNHEQVAGTLLDRMQKGARTPADKELVESFARRLAAHKNSSAAKTKSSDSPAPATPVATGDGLPQQVGNQTQPATSQTEEGLIQDAACTASTITSVRFAILGKTLSLTSPDPSTIAVSVDGKSSSWSAVPCEQWKGRKAKIAFAPAPDEKTPAAIISVDFLK